MSCSPIAAAGCRSIPHAGHISVSPCIACQRCRARSVHLFPHKINWHPDFGLGMPPGGAQLGNEELGTIQEWIEQGAMDN